MQNCVVNMCEKFHYNRLRKDKALADWKSINKKKKKKKKKKKNVRSAWRAAVSGSKTDKLVSDKFCHIATVRRAAAAVYQWKWWVFITKYEITENWWENERNKLTYIKIAAYEVI